MAGDPFQNMRNTKSVPNIFGGYNYYTPNGIVQSHKNNIGGYRYYLPNGVMNSRKNIFKGQSYGTTSKPRYAK